MSFGGHVFDMISRMKSNLAHRALLREKLKDRKAQYISSKQQYASNNDLEVNKISKEELDVIKSYIRKEIAAEQRVYFVKKLIVIVLMISFVVLAFCFLSKRYF